uniref:Protein PAT1 homolog 1 n=1 Tax=Cyprinodon variegatus TaxID=28743 RepID=A0A3Q2CJ93_CYPVA
MFRYSSLDDDCTLEEEDDGLIEEEDEIDQFNDDTFGAGAIGGSSMKSVQCCFLQENSHFFELLRNFLEVELFELEVNKYLILNLRRQPYLGDIIYVDERSGGSDLAESLARFILDADPAIAGVGAAERPAPSPGSAGSVLSALRGLDQSREGSLMSIIKEAGLPKRPPQGRADEGHDLSERAPPPRSSSPVIGSPPVRAVPIGTPPKHPMSLNHQIHHPTAVHVRAPIQHRYPAPFPERLSPNTLLNIANSPLCRGPFPPRVGPVLSQLQRAQLLNSQHIFMSASLQVAGFPRGGPGPPLLAGGGFRPFFGGPPPPHGHRMGPPPPHGPHNHTPPIRHNTTHLHPQHRRLLTQRMQSRGGTGLDRRSRDPYSNLMSQKEKEWVTKIQMMQLQSTDPYLDDYYYQNYYEKMEKRQERERDSSSKKEHATKLITPQVAKVEHTYRPVQFAGSLGKLTVSSVNNPRKMIDAVVTTRSDDEKREKQVWNKRRQILYTVEKMYSLLLEVQDFEKRFVQTPEEEREALLEQHKTNTEQLCSSLQEKEWEDRVSDEQCVMIMSVRKGKRLIARLLPFLPASQGAAVVMVIARNLPALAKKDKQDQVLCCLVEPVSAVIQSLSSSALTDLLQELQGGDGQLAGVLQNKVNHQQTVAGWLISQPGRTCVRSPAKEESTELVFSVTRELLGVPSSSLSPPLFTPPNLLSLFSRYVDRQRLELLQDKLQ